MISQDIKQKYERELDLVEYLASFWNKEAVQKTKEYREHKAKHAFKTESEVTKDVITGDFKNVPGLDAILKIRRSELENSEVKDNKTRLPTNLKNIIKDSV